MDKCVLDTKILDLCGTGLSKLTISDDENKNVTEVLLDNNKLVKIENLENFSTLEKLSISSNLLTRMYGVCRLHQLRELNLSYNAITSIEGLRELSNLTVLNLQGNKIKTMDVLWLNTHLQSINMADNQISSLPDLSMLIELRELAIDGNEIQNLQNCEKFLPESIETLTLSRNRIEDINEISLLIHLSKLHSFSLADNPCVRCDETTNFNYRPFILNWLMSVRIVDGFDVTPIESLKAEWLYSQGKGRHFHVGDQEQVVRYLSAVCSLSDQKLDRENERKLKLILSKAQHHQRQLEEEAQDTSKDMIDPISIVIPNGLNLTQGPTVVTGPPQPDYIDKTPENQLTQSHSIPKDVNQSNDREKDKPITPQENFPPCDMTRDERPFTPPSQLLSPRHFYNTGSLPQVIRSISSVSDLGTPGSRMKSPTLHSNLLSLVRPLGMDGEIQSNAQSNKKVFLETNENGQQPLIGIGDQNDVNKKHFTHQNISTYNEPIKRERKKSIHTLKTDMMQQRKDNKWYQRHAKSSPQTIKSIVLIQKYWRGYQARKRCHNMIDIIYRKRTQEYIEKINSDLERTRVSLENERKIQQLQSQAINVLWKKVSRITTNQTQSSKIDLSNNCKQSNQVMVDGTGNAIDEDANMVMRQLMTTCAGLTNQVRQLQGSMQELLKCMTTFILMPRTVNNQSDSSESIGIQTDEQPQKPKAAKASSSSSSGRKNQNHSMVRGQTLALDDQLLHCEGIQLQQCYTRFNNYL